MTDSDKILQFLQRSSLAVSKIEKEANIPSRTIHKAISNGTAIPEKHISSIFAVLEKYGYSRLHTAKVISIVNNKGGVGKTTTAINLGKGLSLLGYRVLLIDMDAQGNLSQCFNIHKPEIQVIDALLGKNVKLPIIELDPLLHIAPSDIRMSYKETELTNCVGSDRRLTRAISEYLEVYDFIVLDCPPSTNILTTNCLVASDGCIIPIQPEASAFFGVYNLVERIREIRDYSNSSLQIYGIVYTLVQKNQIVHKQMMEHIHETFSHYHIFDTIIELATVIKQSQAAKEDIFTFSSQSKSAEQYMSLTKELIQRY